MSRLIRINFSNAQFEISKHAVFAKYMQNKLLHEKIEARDCSSFAVNVHNDDEKLN